MSAIQADIEDRLAGIEPEVEVLLAEVVGPGRLDPRALLRWNRGVPLVGFSQTAAGAVYVEGRCPSRR